MEPHIKILLNGSIIGLLVKVFYLLCMLAPGKDPERALSQPVKLLFFLEVGYSTALQMSVLVILFAEWYYNILDYLVRLVMLACMSSFVWLSVFYYTKIVPNQRPLFIWLRRNISAVVDVITINKHPSNG
ncbi:unnamed protein product [Coregonus sp. 'balchen']|nr:unnamed protein product [Coregonus sp. 'balchen']